MNLIREGAFITELIFQAELVSNSHEQLKNSVDDFGKISVWSCIQSILISSGNISKILWPISKYKERGKQLRKLLKIDSESVLKSRKFRNKFEHYDEFLDDFLSFFGKYTKNPKPDQFRVQHGSQNGWPLRHPN
jgi:hypothetical protein